MGRRKFLISMRLLTAVLAVALGFAHAIAQNNGNGQGTGQGTIKGNGPSSGNPQPSVCKPGEMLCIKSDDRWLAAIGAADRRAADIRKNGLKDKKKGGN